MCTPSDSNGTTYTRLREIKTQQKKNGLSIDYRPFRKNNIYRISYAANTQSELLKPLLNPAQQGEEKLGGYFDKKAFNLIFQVMEDVISCIKSGGGEFQLREVKCSDGLKGVLKRAVDKEGDKVILSYRFYLQDFFGKEVPAEEIKVFFA